VRLKNHLIALGEWSEERHAALAAELDEHVTQSWKQAVTYGTLTEPPRLDPHLMFEDVFKHMPPHLHRQAAELRAELEAG
jgi:2-oxoisovalerate dehydrogenase E1 component alpha subunit